MIKIKLYGVFGKQKKEFQYNELCMKVLDVKWSKSFTFEQ